MNSTFYLWPDHVIGKRESRAIREHHNACENNRADLCTTLERLNSLAGENGVPLDLVKLAEFQNTVFALTNQALKKARELGGTAP